MSHKLDHLEIRKMLEFVGSMDIGKNPEPAAIFDPLSQGFNVWCIPSDHPGGEWESVIPGMIAGAFTKRCEYVGAAYYRHEEGYMAICTDAYALRDKFPRRYNVKTIKNRPEDLKWVESKVRWVFEQIGVPCPELRVEDV